MTNDPIAACLEKINVSLNWSRMHREAWRITVTKINSPAVLSNVVVPWYFDPLNKAVRYDHVDARPVNVGQAAASLGRWSDGSQAIIAKYAAIFQATEQPVRFMLPAYRLSFDALLLLDGSHRAVALTISNRAFELWLVVVDGPVDSNALPDLKHWEK